MYYSIIILSIFILILLYIIVQYNGFIRSKTLVEEAWSVIDVVLKKRYDLIPNLVNTVKGYASHEKDTFQKIVEARNEAMKSNGVNEQSKAEENLSQSLVNLNLLVEQYPELNANETFLQLQESLNNVETEIAKARRYYNGTVRDLNIKVDSFPTNIIANIFNFKDEPFFQLEHDSERKNHEVQF